jgi:hypothetical protein
MSSSEPSKGTIDSVDTELPADSVEFCPRAESRHVLVCGTYNLVKNSEENKDSADVKQPQTRNGRCLVYEVDEFSQKLHVRFNSILMYFTNVCGSTGRKFSALKQQPFST